MQRLRRVRVPPVRPRMQSLHVLLLSSLLDPQVRRHARPSILTARSFDIAVDRAFCLDCHRDRDSD